MRQLLFTGFNAFGQHKYKYNEAGSETKRARGFSEIVPHTTTSGSGNFVVALSWRYTAYASNRKLWLRGLVSKAPSECLEVDAPAAIKALAAGETHCLVLLENGALYKVQVKLQATLQAVRLEEPPALPEMRRPPKRSIFGAAKATSSHHHITHIACGAHINVAVSASNAVYSLPSCLHQFPTQTWRLQQLVCGHEHALLLNGNGDVYAWGNGLRGQLGQAELRSEETPTLLEALAGVKITHIAAGGWHSAAISAFGDLYTWGLNCNGQLGMRVLKRDSVLKEPTVYPLPQLHDLPACCKSAENNDEEEDAACAPVRVFAGARHTVLLRRCGRIWASGWCAYGQLGDLNCEQPYSDVFQCVSVKLDCDIVCGPWATLLVLST